MTRGLAGLRVAGGVGDCALAGNAINTNATMIVRAMMGFMESCKAF